jgi:hypothetical protein
MRVVDIDRIGRGEVAFGVDEAWVVDPADRRMGAMTSRALSGGRPQLVIRPGPIAELEAAVERNRAAGGPRAVRLCPGSDGHDYPLEPWAISPLPEYCDREGIAILIDPGPSSIGYPWAPIVRLARDHPSLVVVALAAPLGGTVAARGLDAAPNLILETSALTDDDGEAFARLVATVGGHRFAYGSGDAVVSPSVVASSLRDDSAPAVLSGTADLIDRGAWGPTYL